MNYGGKIIEEEDEDLERDEEEALSCLAVAALAAFVVLELGNIVQSLKIGNKPTKL